MAKERDYKREYELQKGKRMEKIVGVGIPSTVFSELNLKLNSDNITKNAFLKACIKAYLDDEITVDDLIFYM